jgi:hypothetical protein
MRAKAYPAIVEAVDSGVACGLARADKYADDPLTDAQRQRVEQHVNDQVLSAIAERFDFEDGNDSSSVG